MLPRLFAKLSPMAIAADTYMSNELTELGRYVKSPFVISSLENQVAQATELLGEAEELFKIQAPGSRMFIIERVKTKANQVWQTLCQIIEYDYLVILATRLRNSIDVIPDPQLREKVAADLDKLAEAVSSHLSGDSLLNDNEINQQRRLLLNTMIRIHGFEALALHRSSVIRWRAFMMLWVIACLLVIAIFLLPYALDQVKWYHIFGIQIMGALGGALSSLQLHGMPTALLHQYYIEETLANLRPAVGATAALGISLMQLAGLLQILPGLSDDISKQLPVLMFVSFIAGFSERFFVERVESFGSGGRNPSGPP